MRVRLTTSLLWYGRAYDDGDEIDLPSDVAQRYIATRQAELIEPAVETAALRTLTTQGRIDGRSKATRPRP